MKPITLISILNKYLDIPIYLDNRTPLITCPIIKSWFHKHTLKYAEVVEDCTVTSDLRGN